MTHSALTTVASIQAFHPGITFSTGTSTAPNAAEVTQWIAEGTEVIYSRLSAAFNITSDITDSAALLVLKPLCDLYVNEFVSFSKDRGRTSIATNGVIYPRSVNLTKFYEYLDKICTGEIALPNVYRITSSASYNNTNSITFKSSKETDQW
jgi:hypothetical protein